MSEIAARREAVLASLAAEPGHPVSGERLAVQLGCSRSAVHRHVGALRRAGVTVSGTPDGYVLDADADVVVPSAVESRLEPPLAGPVLWRAETGSTNDDAVAEARAGAGEGLIVGADRQRAGRGRRGRRWLSGPGDALLVSFLLRPPVAPVDAATLPLLVAVAVASACGPEARIAWPNDVLIGGRKVAGVLIESSADHERVAWAVAGVGINVRAAPRLADARWEPAALPEPPPRRAELLVSLATELGRRYEGWGHDGPETVLAEYATRDALAGRRIQVTTGDAVVTGVGRGVDDLGRLVVEDGRGERSLAVGEVTGVDPEGRSSG